MPVIQTRNSEMAALLSADLLSSNDRNVVFSAYDAVGHSFTTAETHAMATERVNTAPTVFSWSGSELTILAAGLFLLSFQGTFLKVGTTAEAEASVWLEQDPASGSYALVPGTTLDVYLPTSGRNSVTMIVPLWVADNYKYRIRVARNSGSDVIGLVTNQSMITALNLYLNR